MSVYGKQKISWFAIIILFLFTLISCFSNKNSDNNAVVANPLPIELQEIEDGITGKQNFLMPIDARLLNSGELLVLYENRGIKSAEDYDVSNNLVHFDKNGMVKAIYYPGLWFAHTLEITENGTYLISDHGNSRLLEIAPDGTVQAEISQLDKISVQLDFNSAVSTGKGDILACIRGWGIAEFDKKGKVKWSYKINTMQDRGRLSHGVCHDATRLPNNHILYSSTFDDRVVEIDRNGKEIWSFKNEKISIPKNSKRLKNGDTIISHSKGLSKVSKGGKIIAKRDDLASCYNFNVLENGNILVINPINGILLLNQKFETIHIVKSKTPKSWKDFVNKIPKEDADRLKSLGYLN